LTSVVALRKIGLVTRTTYKEAFQQAKEEFDALRRQRDAKVAEVAEIEERIVQVRRGVTALAALAGEDLDDMALGLTEAVRALLSAASGPLTTQGVVSGIRRSASTSADIRTRARRSQPS